MNAALLDKEKLINAELQLAPRKLLYLYGSKAYICDENSRYGTLALDETKYDVVNAINSIHNVRSVWASLKDTYSINDHDTEAKEALLTYLMSLIESGMLSIGNETKHVYGDWGRYYPLHLSIELTDKCNFKCKHCYKDAKIGNSTFLNSTRLIDFLSFLNDKVYSFELTGGEATLHPDFCRIVRSAPKKKCTLLTNGSTLTTLPEDVLHRLSDIQVTLYGSSEEEYFNCACTTQFKKVCDGLGRVTSLDIPCSAAIVLHSSNINHIDMYFELMSKLGIHRVSFGLNSSAGRNIDDTWSLSRKACEKFADELESIKQSYPNIIMTDFYWQDDYDNPPLPKSDNYVIVCDAGTKSVVVSERGFIRPCNLMPADCFDEIDIEGYIRLLKEGQSLSFERGVAKCAKKYQAIGRNIDSICATGFSTV